jgi:hypothetical protein
MAKVSTLHIEWDAHEYEHKERSADWFWAVGILTVSFAIVSILLGNIIFGILILLSVFTLSLYINRPPQIIHAFIDNQGIVRDKVRYPYDTLHGYWVDEDHPHKKIILRSKKTLMPLIIIPIGEKVDPEKLRDILAEYLPEERLDLPLAEKVLEYLGF